jgi:hypothetical protein
LFHDGVAVTAHQAAGLVRAAIPVSSLATFVAGETDCIVFFRRARSVFRPERDDGDAASAAGFHVRRPRTMAAFALEFAFLGFGKPAHQGMVEAAWQVTQTFVPTLVASIGAPWFVPPAMGPFGVGAPGDDFEFGPF